MYVQKLSRRDEAGRHSLTEQIERWHDENLFLPLVKRLRQEDGWTPGTTVPPHLVRLRSIDGGTAALKAILRARSQGDVDLKHGSQTSSACQAFDVGACARSSKALVRSGTTNDIVESGASRSLKCIIERETKRAGVNLTTRRKKCLFPFISKFPDITAAACSSKNILSGFYQNGTIDPKTNKPNIDKLLRTCNRTWETERWSHCTKVLRTDVVPLFHLNGEVTEDQWDDMKVKLDTDKAGKIIKRKFTVAGMRRKRSLLPNHSAVRRHYDNLMRMAVNNKSKQRKKFIDSIKEDLVLNQQAEQALSDLHDEDMTIIVKLSKVTAPRLRGYIRARHTHDNLPSLSGINKGKPSDAEDVDNLLRRALSVYQQPVVLITPEVEDENTDDDVSDRIRCALEVSNTGDPTPQTEYTHVTMTYLHRVWNILRRNAFRSRGVNVPRTQDDVVRVEETSRVLYQKLHSRLISHVRQHLGSHAFQHWFTTWIFSQLPRVSTVLVLLGHVKSQNILILYSGDDDNILEVEVDKWSPIHPDHVGIYGHFDLHRRRWVRSGKCLSSRSAYTFHDRLQNHVDGSRQPKKSLFYNSYHHDLTITRGRDTPVKGLFNDLKPCMMLGWKYDETSSVVNIVEWSTDVLDCSSRSKHNLWVKGELIRKEQMFVYLFELCYQLCMSVHDVISESPGCEVPWFMFTC